MEGDKAPSEKQKGIEMAYTQNVSAGMVVTGEVVDSGIQIIDSGGIASNAVASGGAVQVNSGGRVSGFTAYEGTDGALAGTIAAGGNVYDLDATDATISNAGTVSGGVLNGTSFLQNVAGGSAFDIVIKDEARLEAAGAGCGLANITVDAAGQETEVGVTSAAAELIVFQSGCYVEGLTLRNGGSAHVYAQGAVYDVVVENGGVLYMTDWDFDTALDWQGLPRPQDGKVDGATVKSGGTLWIGGSSANVRNVTVEEGGYITGFHVMQTIRNLEVYNGSGYDTITYSNGVIRDFDLSGMNNGQGTILYDRGWVSNASTAPTNITGISIKQDVGLFTDINFYSTVKGTYTFTDGTTKELNMSAGKITSFVLGSGMRMAGTMSKYTTAAGADKLEISDLMILDGGILDGFVTGRAGDGSYVNSGTYRFADGTVRNWSFGNGTADGLVINSGCFVIQGISADGKTDAGVTNNLLINDGILVVANGSMNTNLTITGDTALQVYGSATIINGINMNYQEGDEYYNFSVENGVAQNLVITNGGFYYSGDGTVIENSIVEGGREHTSGNADYANSVLQISGGGTAKDVIVKSGAILKLSGDFTLENVVVEEGAIVDWATPSSGFELINTVLPNYENVKFEDGTVYNWYTSTTFKPDGSLKFVDVTLKNIDYNGFTLKNGKVDEIDGMIFDCDPDNPKYDSAPAWASGWAGDCYGDDGDIIKNLTLNGGKLAISVDLENVIIDNHYNSESYILNNNGQRTVTAKNIHITGGGGYFYIGGSANANNDCNVIGLYCDSAKGMVTFRDGSIEDLTMTAGQFFSQYGDVANHIYKGDIYFENVTIDANNQDHDIVIDGTDSFVLAGNNTIKIDIVENTKGQTITFKGANNVLGPNRVAPSATVKVSATNIVFDQVDSWFLADGIVNNLGQLQYTNLTFEGRLGQGDYVLGAGSANFKFTFGGQSVSLTLGNSVTVDGYTISYATVDGMQTVTVRADASTNTAMVWDGTLSDAAMAIRYVNDLAAGDGQTINLGAAMENAGGNGVNYVGGVVATGAIVTDAQTNSYIYGGAADKAIGGSWIKVEGGSGNYIYGGGNGQAMGDANVLVTGGSTKRVFGGSLNSTVDNVKLEVTGGSHEWIVGGNDFSAAPGGAGAISGDVNVVISGTSSVSGLIAGGGFSNVAGDVNVTLNIAGEAAASTANIFGGVQANGAAASVGGNINLKMSGNYQGIVWGGNHAYGAGATASVVDINVDATDVTLTNNDALLEEGQTSWIIGGGRAIDGGQLSVTGTTTVNVANSTLSFVVGGSQVEGAGSAATLADVSVTVTESVINGDIYGAGYVRDGGVLSVGDVDITIDSTNRTDISGNIFAGGNNVGGAGTIVVNGDIDVTFTGVGDNLGFYGLVSGGASRENGFSVAGTSSITFDDFTGAFNGVAVSFDMANFGGNTVMSVASGSAVETSAWTFDVVDRTENGAFVSDAASFNLVGDSRNVNLVLDFDALSEDMSWDLIDVSDESLDGVLATLFDAEGNKMCDFDLTTGSWSNSKGTFSFKQENGMLSFTFDAK